MIISCIVIDIAQCAVFSRFPLIRAESPPACWPAGRGINIRCDGVSIGKCRQRSLLPSNDSALALSFSQQTTDARMNSLL